MSQEAARVQLIRHPRYSVSARNFQRELNRGFNYGSSSSGEENENRNSADIGEQNHRNPWREVKGSFVNAVENEPKGAEMVRKIYNKFFIYRFIY